MIWLLTLIIWLICGLSIIQWYIGRDRQRSLQHSLRLAEMGREEAEKAEDRAVAEKLELQKELKCTQAAADQLVQSLRIEEQCTTLLRTRLEKIRFAINPLLSEKDNDPLHHQ